MKSIAIQVQTSLLVTVLVVLGGWGYLELRNTTRLELEHLRHDHRTITERLAYSLVYPLWNLNLAETEKIIHAEAVGENVRAILLYDDSGVLYAGMIRKSSKEEGVTAYNASNPLHRQLLALHQNSTSRDIIKNGKSIGKVVLYVSDDHLQATIRQQKIALAFKLLGLLAAISCVQFFVLRKVVIQPLTLLKEWVLSIESGQLPPLPQMNRCEEIDVLAVSFSEMAERLTRSLTEQEKTNHLLRSVMDNTFQLQGLLSPDGKLIDINETALRMINVSRESVLGQNFCETPWWDHDPALREKVCQAVAGAAAGEFIRFEGEHADASGELHYIDFSIKPVSDDAGDIIYLIPEGRDITELKRTQEELQRHRAHLEELVRERTAALQASQRDLINSVAELNLKKDELEVAKERAEAADRLKSSFLATMSHELRTPLNSIIGFTGILLQGLGGPLNEEQAKQLAMVKNSANHLLSLISDVLDISKIEAGQLTVSAEAFNLRETILKIVRSVQPLAEKKGLDLTIDVAEDVFGVCADERRVEQILLNLLSNAVKFTEVGGITVRCRREAGTYVTTVTDTGIGIDGDDLDRLFTPFHQIDSGLSRKYEGTGLGLSICKRLVELMGGGIRVESSPGQGSTFAFTLPSERSPA
jgi:PAS domain S-box-containing protein